MISRRYETIVGVFVVVSLVVLLIMVLIIARQEGLFEQYVEYRAIFKNVSGLKAGSEIHLAGVTVGNVKDITISREGSTLVTFHVVKKYSDRVRADSLASIGYMGLLGEKSLDLTTGSPNQPPIPPEGWVGAVEPLDITQMLAKAGPGLEDLTKILHNLAEITGGMTKPGGDLTKILDQVKQIVTKINEGKGSLGLLVNDPTLYKETTQTVGGVKKVFGEVDKSFFGSGAKEKTQQTLADFHKTMSSAGKTASNLQEATTGLPGMMKKADSFLDNLKKAGKSLPELITEAETTVSDVDKTSKAAQKSWLLRRHVPQPQEHTIRMDGEAGKE
jgi:phospholipid/cholesterol/gamma-HCH transport system substrate-binding protein